jgi:predicted DNA-binding antitoxin AbrB/MazE fold protein
MSQILTAIFENGVFVPDHAPVVPAGQRVRLVVEPIAQSSQSAMDEFDAICDELSIDDSQTRMTRDQLHERH